MKKKILSSLLALLAVGISGAKAAEVMISSDIATSTTWTADNTYNLQKQVYVLPGATLTIEPGTLLKSTAGVGGSLAVCRGAKIYVNGTQTQPVIMTSTNDNMTSWREVCNEWGNLTIMGNAVISASHFGGVQRGNNTKNPTGLNEAAMEGLVADYPGDTKVMYGGPDDNDDSGSVSFLSLRYGGKVIGLGNELNGLSLGGIGRETDLNYIEVMNNVDDGIEIWGGTVNLKHFSIWNIGDDSLDVDQGWRGKAQFGLIVQGSSDVNGYQGGGLGDNCIEIDGAEDSDAQPVTTVALYNLTVIGQPVSGDHGTAWRDNGRVQFRNSIFMDLGEELVKLDNKDGDGANGYGYNGTLSWIDTWNTDYSYARSTTQPNAGNAFVMNALYNAQVDGKLSEISDSVFFRNLHPKAYEMATTVGVFNPANNNVIATVMPIKDLQRSAPVNRGGLTILPVTFINPLAANDATTSVKTAPDDGFFTPAQYRGAFCSEYNWLTGWTAAYAYGMTQGTALPQTGINPDLNGDGIVDMLDFAILSESWLQ